MDRRKILQDALDMARHNYHCYSRWEGKFDLEEQEENFMKYFLFTESFMCVKSYLGHYVEEKNGANCAARKGKNPKEHIEIALLYARIH